MLAFPGEADLPNAALRVSQWKLLEGGVPRGLPRRPAGQAAAACSHAPSHSAEVWLALLVLLAAFCFVAFKLWSFKRRDQGDVEMHMLNSSEEVLMEEGVASRPSTPGHLQLRRTVSSGGDRGGISAEKGGRLGRPQTRGDLDPCMQLFLPSQGGAVRPRLRARMAPLGGSGVLCVAGLAAPPDTAILESEGDECACLRPVAPHLQEAARDEAQPRFADHTQDMHRLRVRRSGRAGLPHQQACGSDGAR